MGLIKRYRAALVGVVKLSLGKCLAEQRSHRESSLILTLSSHLKRAEHESKRGKVMTQSDVPYMDTLDTFDLFLSFIYHHGTI